MSPTKRRLTITLATLLLIAMIPAGVMAAGGTFIDDDDSIFEANIEWLASAGVTLGCNPAEGNTKFCPNNNVTRGQMAAFMQRFAQYIDAEDGTPGTADHALTADEATSADNAATVDGKNAIEFQPALYDFEGNVDFQVTSIADHVVATAEVTTTSATWFCLFPATPTANILVRASGYTSGVGSGESAWFKLAENGTLVEETGRYISNADGTFAMEWLFKTGGGTDEFTLVIDENSGTDDFWLINGQITAEVVQDTRCEGNPIIIFPGNPEAPVPDSELTN